MSIDRTTPKLIVIVGPTASGKTDLGIRLAQKFRGEIVSADSRQVYREFSIGTDKPTGKWQIANGQSRYVVGGVIHHLVDEVDPKEEFTLVDFKKRAQAVIKDVCERGRVAFLVGGTPLYVYALVQNLEIPAVPPQPAFRSRLSKKPLEELYAELKKIDPPAAEITGRNRRRIVRALEVIRATGKKFSSQRQRGPKLFETLKLGLALDKNRLDERIKIRLDEMMKRGLLNEVKKLALKYYWAIPPMQSIDYQEFRRYFAGEETLEDTLKKILKAHKSLARRQMTWFKRDKEIRWIKNYTEAEGLVGNFLLGDDVSK